MLNFSLLLALLGSLFSWIILIAFIITFILKCLIDLPLLWKATGFFRQRQLLWYFLPFQFIYFIFISFTGTLGNILPYRWKSR
jgi:hypothetical protein